MENPQYILGQDFKRGFVPQVVLMLFLGALFFLGVKFNINLLNLDAPPYLDYIVLIGIIILISINLLLIYKKIKIGKYIFYANRIEFSGKKRKGIYFSEVSGIYFKKNILDKLFNTGTIVLEPGFSVRNIGDTNQIYFYIQRLVQYARRSAYQKI